jgi:hypothetical protein
MPFIDECKGGKSLSTVKMTQAATFAFRAEGPTIGRDAGIDVGEHA